MIWLLHHELSKHEVQVTINTFEILFSSIVFNCFLYLKCMRAHKVRHTYSSLPVLASFLVVEENVVAVAVVVGVCWSFPKT